MEGRRALTVVVAQNSSGMLWASLVVPRYLTLPASRRGRRFNSLNRAGVMQPHARWSTRKCTVGSHVQRSSTLFSRSSVCSSNRRWDGGSITALHSLDR